MAKSSDGGFLVESTRIPEPKLVNTVQHFGFTEGWKPTSYSIKVMRKDSVEKTISLLCQYLPDAISCNAVTKGIQSKGSLPTAGPRVFLPPRFGTDIFWMMATVCAQAERTPGRITNVAEISIKDNPDPSVLELEVGETLPVAYIGQEKLQTVLGTNIALKFRIQDMTVWTADSGLVLAITSEGSDNGERIELSSLNDTTNILLRAPIRR
jgi:hypothetical protein